MKAIVLKLIIFDVNILCNYNYISLLVINKCNELIQICLIISLIYLSLITYSNPTDARSNVHQKQNN